ncbi:MAG: type II toxin-antitoxin system prevent-host-death family antitoxin [Steroidobacteraceae bacterium]
MYKISYNAFNEVTEAMKFLPISEARAIIGDVAEDAQSTVLTRNGQPLAVVMPVAEYRALRALAKLAANPDAALRVAEVHERVSRGKVDGYADVSVAGAEYAGTLRAR